MTPLAHIMILASAGSGKTYALTNRFVELLARGATPERIVALTFTRKAAGEFFDEILNKLAGAARNENAAARLARDIGAPHLQPADFLLMLRSVADAMHRLRLGTLDGFFARIARVFPFELGLSGGFEILEEHAARLERQRVLRRMFTRSGELDAAQKEFIEAFKRATFGAEEKQLGPKLDAFLDAHQERYLEAQESALWGEPARIWPQGNAWLEAEVDRVAAVRDLRAWTSVAPIAEKQRARWEAFLTAFETWAPGAVLPRELIYVLEKALAVWPALMGGQAVLEFDRKKQELDAGPCAALADLTRHVIGGELVRRLATTRGIHAVLRGYEVIYHEAVRRAGKLTFGDVQRLLLPGGGGGVLTGEPGAAGRLFVDYRLDAGIDHWLLDEFQDTSFGQWSVLRNLIDEVVQDTSGERSFFCVGDVKQAIFTWREGDPRLFREIFNHYNSAAPGAVLERHLVDSWRSGPPIIEMVNGVFGAGETIRELFPGGTADTWNQEWRAHVSAVPERAGQAALILAEDGPERWARVVEILHEIQPLERGLTCAVLVPKNTMATELADYLRREAGVPAVAESDLHVCTDNPLGAALLSLVLAAAHPGDTISWEHVQMTPLGAALAAEGVITREDATARVLAQVHADGFERTMEWWLRKLEPGLMPNDAFNRLRGRQFTAAAARYDRTGSRDIGEFAQFMERHVLREVESAAVVRVMTIHKSKGLGFDVVILPELQGNRLDERRGGLAVQKAKDRTVEWVLELPAKLCYGADDVLSQHVAAAESEAGYEALSLLYVALTRAKRALYAIIEPVGKSVSRNYPKLLSETLGAKPREICIGALARPGLWSSGNPGWHRALEAPKPDPAPRRETFGLLDVAVHRPALRRNVQRPSGQDDGRVAVAQIFAWDRTTGQEFGAAVHALLAEVEWKSAADLPCFAETWRARGAKKEVIEEAMACLRAPALAALWTAPDGRAEVWRERAFEVVLDDVWITGIFDRVVIRKNAAEQAIGATVFDFKTDRIVDDVDVAAATHRHMGQLNLYRRVIALLARLPLAAIEAKLVFTRQRRSVTVAAPES